MAKWLTSSTSKLLGGGGFSPLSLPSIAVWRDFSDLTTLFQDTAGATPVTTDAQVIKRANDKSGNNRTASNTNSDIAYKAAIQNGRGVARATTANSILNSDVDIARNTAGLTVLAVVSITDPNAAAFCSYFFTNGSGGSRAQLDIGQNLIRAGGRRLDADGFQNVTVAYSGTGFAIIAGIWDFANAQLYVVKSGSKTARGGGFQTAGNSADTAGLTSTLFSATVQERQIGEMLICRAALTSAQINQAARYLAARWGVTWADVA